MIKRLIPVLALFSLVGAADATLFYQGTGIATAGGTAIGSVGGGGIIADGNPVGMATSMDLSGQALGASLQSITVSLNVSGGMNSDLYAYLSYNGQSVVLLNRIGVSSGVPFGNTGSGLNVTLDSSSANIHNTAAGGYLTGPYQADGQTTSPTSAVGSFSLNGNGAITLNGTFANTNPNGVWTLFFADVVAGGGNETLNGWSLNITAVPEPVPTALGICGGVLAVGALFRWRSGCGRQAG